MGGELVEIDRAGNRQIWGHVVEWGDGTAFAVTWHPGKTSDEQTRVRITFEADGTGTLVTRAAFEVKQDLARMIPKCGETA